MLLSTRPPGTQSLRMPKLQSLSVSRLPPFGTKFAPHPLSFAKQKLLKLEHTKYEKKIEKFKCHREMSQIDLSVRALEHLFVFRGSNKHDCLFSWLSWPRRRTPVLRRWNRNSKSRKRITIPSWLRSIRKSPSFASPRSSSVDPITLERNLTLLILSLTETFG